MNTIAPNLYPLLISIIDESYTDGLDRISSARLNDDDTVLVVGIDGAKQIGVKISDLNIKIRLLNPDPIDTNSAAFSDSNIYQQLGMRLVELALEVEFAAPKAKNNGSLKKKTCKTGLSCGGTCISKSKVCARALSIDQQKQFKELKKRLKGGNSDAQKGIQDLKDEQQGIKKEPTELKESPVGGQLTTTPKKPEKEKEDLKVKKTAQEQINDKYSSENPTDDDAKSWLADTIEARNNPTPENVEARTAAEMARQNRRYESGVDSYKFSAKILDRKSYALAAQAAERWEKKKYPDLVERRTDPAVWLSSRMSRGDGLRVTQIPALEKKLATTKSDAVKKTVAKQLASLKEDVRREPEVREQAQKDAAKWQAIYSSSKVDRIKQLEKDFDAESAKTKIAMESTYADIKAGKKSAVEDAANDAGRVGGVNRRPGNKPGTYKPVSVEDVKDRLKEMGAAKSEEMFSVGLGATKADIRQQYRVLAGIHHPDKGGSSEKFRSLNDAYNKIMEKLN